MFYGGGGMRFILPYLCEREGLCDGISDGCEVGGGRRVSGSSVLWPTAVDFCSNPVPMVGLFRCVGDSVSNDDFGFQEAAHGLPMDGLPGSGTGLLSPLVDSSARVSSLRWLAWRWSMGIHRCKCVFGGPRRWLLWHIPSFGASRCCHSGLDGTGVLVKKPCVGDRLKKVMDLVVFFISFRVLDVSWGCTVPSCPSC
jgi:hypothetical protein